MYMFFFRGLRGDRLDRTGLDMKNQNQNQGKKGRGGERVYKESEDNVMICAIIFVRCGDA